MPTCQHDPKDKNVFLTHTPMWTDVKICYVPSLFQGEKKKKKKAASKEADWRQEDRAVPAAACTKEISMVDPILKMQKVDQSLNIYKAVFFQGYKKGWPNLRSPRK